MQNVGQKPGSAWNLGRAMLIFVVVIIASFVAWSLFHTIEPHHGRRDALLRHLRDLAAEVNAYKQRSGSLPRSLDEIPFVTIDGAHVPTGYCPYPDGGYQLIVQPNHHDFLIVADHIFKDIAGAEFHFASDGNLQIQKVPSAKDEPQRPPAADEPGG